MNSMRNTTNNIGMSQIPETGLRRYDVCCIGLNPGKSE